MCPNSNEWRRKTMIIVLRKMMRQTEGIEDNVAGNGAKKRE
jgi:hypothetical protein